MAVHVENAGDNETWTGVCDACGFTTRNHPDEDSVNTRLEEHLLEPHGIPDPAPATPSDDGTERALDAEEA
jgi:hypothetical protein